MINRTVTIRIVTDNNTASPGLRCEHGLSLWIEADDRVVLFDTGQGPALRENTEFLGLDLKRVDSVVLSHGHNDHSGGLSTVIEAKKERVPTFLHVQSRRERFSRSSGKTRSIGLSEESQAALRRLPSDDVFETEAPTCVRPGIWVTGSIPRTYASEGFDDKLFLPDNTPDTVEDDQALFIRTPSGVVVLIGCGHAGLANTLNYIKKLAPGPIRAVIGGFHLFRADHRSFWESVEQTLRYYEVERVVPCHCTGEEATHYLVETLGSRCHPGRAGDLFRF